MVRILIETTLVLGVLGCAPLAGRAPALEHCLPLGSEGEALVGYARMLAEPTSEKLRATAEAYQIPRTASSQVGNVADQTLCRRASINFGREVGDHDPFERRVRVVRIGTARDQLRYLVTDPDYRMGEYGVVIIFDHRFQPLASFTN